MLKRQSQQLLSLVYFLCCIWLRHPTAATSSIAFDPDFILEERASLPDDMEELIEAPESFGEVEDAERALSDKELMRRLKNLPAATARKRSKLPKNWCVFHPVSCHG